MQEPQPVIIAERPRFEAQPESPELPQDGVAIDFRLVPARAASGPTVALFAACRLPGRYGDVYGGRLPGAFTIVAVETRTGQVYHNTPDRPHAVPLARAMRPFTPPAGGARRLEVDCHFNVDLAYQLGLPAQGGHYAVFLWIDDLVSAVKYADLPPAPERPGTSAPPAGAAESEGGRILMAPPGTPTPEPLQLSAKREPPDSARAAERTLVRAVIAPAAVAAEEPSGTEPSITFLGLCFRTRDVGARSLSLPAGAMRQAVVGVELDAARLVSCAPAAGPTFLLAYLGGRLSNVVSLP